MDCFHDNVSGGGRTTSFPRLFSDKGIVFKLGTIFLLALVMLLFFFAIAACSGGLSDSSYYIYVFQAVMAVMVFLVPALCCAFLFYANGQSLFSYLGQHKLPRGLLFVLGVVLMSLSVQLTTVLGEWNKMVFPEDEAQTRALVNLLTQGDASFLYLRLLVVAFIPALTEEMFFRGLLQNTLAGYMGSGAAIVLTALVFALVHADMSGVLPRFALGMVLGYLLVRSDSLWLPIACHFLNNAFVVLIYYYFYDPALEVCSVEVFMAESVPLLLLSVVGFLLVFFAFHKLSKADYAVYSARLQG